jgi:hypothetical protein
MRKLFIITALLLFAGIAFGQTLNKGSIIAVHNYDIIFQPDVTSNQFLEFMEKTYTPNFEKAFPGTTLVSLMGDRGALVNKYGGMIIFDSIELRDKYYPIADEEGEGTGWNEEQQKTVQMLNEGMSKLVISFERTYTDWKIL